MFIDSKVKTTRLYCTICKKKLKKGENVVFELDEENERRFMGVSCRQCADKKGWFPDSTHPFSSEAIGQW